MPDLNPFNFQDSFREGWFNVNDLDAKSPLPVGEGI